MTAATGTSHSADLNLAGRFRTRSGRSRALLPKIAGVSRIRPAGDRYRGPRTGAADPLRTLNVEGKRLWREADWPEKPRRFHSPS